MPAKTLIVLGMHRSGTSMLSGVLQRLNIPMGENQIKSDISYPMGHFEDTDFFNLNEHILRSAGGSWDNPPKHQDILTQGEKYSIEIYKLISLRNKNPIWGWKDPRTSLTAELFISFIEDGYFFRCHRNELDIAKSLNRRNGMSIDEAIYLTRLYELRIDNFFTKNSNTKKLDIYYEDVINDPLSWLNMICSFLNISPTTKSLSKANKFIKSRKQKKYLYIKYRSIELIIKGTRSPWKTPLFILKKFLYK
ncbi:MAG: sulfotransferase [Bacteroidota bacterium]